jgi:hypothetical protein
VQPAVQAFLSEHPAVQWGNEVKFFEGEGYSSSGVPSSG